MALLKINDPTPSFHAVNAELEALRNDPEPVALTMDKVSAWVALSQIQLALRHPANTGPASEIARNVALCIQEALCPDPDSALARVAQDGWDDDRLIVIPR